MTLLNKISEYRLFRQLIKQFDNNQKVFPFSTWCNQFRFHKLCFTNIINTTLWIVVIFRNKKQRKVDNVSITDLNANQWPWNSAWLLCLLTHAHQFNSIESRSVVISFSQFDDEMYIARYFTHDLNAYSLFYMRDNHENRWMFLKLSSNQLFMYNFSFNFASSTDSMQYAHMARVYGFWENSSEFFHK